MQWFDNAVKNLNPVTKYTRQQLISMLREDAPMLNEGSYQWAVGGLVKSGNIIRTGFDEYMLAEGNVRPEYEPNYTDFASGISGKVAERFPQIRFTIFETVLLNEFLNHLIAQNTVFVQAEKDISIFVFRFLQESGFANVMYKPSQKDYDLYWAANSIVVTDMISEAPLSSHDPHAMTLEKMLVDIYCDKLIRNTYSKAEYPMVMEQAMTSYKVEKPKLLRYARRRNKEKELQVFISAISKESI